MRKALDFLRQYKFFSTIIVTSLIGIGLQLSGHGDWARWLVSGVALATCLPLLWDMWHDLRSGTYGIDILAVTAIVTSVILGEYWAAAVIVIMLTGGEALEDYAERRAKTELSALLERAPQKATVLRGRKTVSVKASDVQAGDKLLIKPGEIVPVDATILDGSGDFDESALTGESLPVSKQTGDDILSGSANIDGAITAKALRNAKESQYGQIVKLVQAASKSQAPYVRLADRYAIPFTIIAFTIAGCAWIATHDPMRFLQVIVVATPCPLILAAPIAIISGMSRSAKAGIIVKHGGALERLAEAKSLAFDKTGTLTLGKLEVAGVETVSDLHSRDEVLSMAATLEQQSNHVVAKAIVDAAKSDGLKLAKVRQLKEKAGQGLSATYGGKQVLVGRLSYLQDHDVDVSSLTQRSAGITTHVAVNGKLAGIISFSDTIRPESADTISRLKALGYKTIHLVTGDNAGNAQRIAKQVGIQDADITADALPADKLRAIEKLGKPVAFIGDGVNDAPVLTAADVGIALGARGSTVASESADIVIMKDDVSKVATAAGIAKRTFSIATQSIMIGIVISIGLMAVYATGKFSALSGAIVQELVDVIVIFNALRAHTGKTE